MPSIATTSIQAPYTHALLNGSNTVTDMKERGFLPISKQYACRQLAKDPAPHQHALHRRLPDAPKAAFLAGDLLTVRHEGQQIQGVGRQHDSSRKALSWGHTFTSSALVRPGEDPFLLRCDPFLTAGMSTKLYPHLSPSEALLNVVGDVITTGYEPAGVLADAQFCSRLSMRSLKAMRVPFVMRFRKSSKVMFEAQLIKAQDLAERFRPGQARWYPKLRRYVKRLKVVIPEVGMVDLLIVWKPQGFGWYLSVLVSTLLGGVQDVMRAWNSRWSLEVSHRFRKQSLGLGSCRCLSFSAHLMHADLVVEAFNLVRSERCSQPGLTWKAARGLAAERLGKHVLTDSSRIAA